jgi:hypothetical protein
MGSEFLWEDLDAVETTGVTATQPGERAQSLGISHLEMVKTVTRITLNHNKDINKPNPAVCEKKRLPAGRICYFSWVLIRGVI